MKKVAYHNTIIDVETGEGIQATITVYDAGTTDLATIYSDENGTSKDNPFETDTYGRFNFYSDQGEYDIKVSGTGISPYTIEDVTILVPSRSIVKSDPSSGEYLLKELRLNSAKKTVVTYSSAAE